MQITQNHIDALKGKCPECSINGTALHNFPCEICNNSSRATIEIDKEFINAKFGGKEFQKDIKIPKYKVGDEIIVVIDVNETTYYEETTITINKKTLKLKIISETEDKWRVCLA